MDATLEVQTELERLVHQPFRLVDTQPRRHNRVDSDGREHHEHGDNREEFPTQVSHGVL